MSQIVPRFRGNAVKIGKHWSWELFITFGNQEGEPLVMSSKESFISRASALTDMKRHIPEIMKITCEAMGLPEFTGVHDLNKGVLETLEEWQGRKEPG